MNVTAVAQTVSVAAQVFLEKIINLLYISSNSYEIFYTCTLAEDTMFCLTSLLSEHVATVSFDICSSKATDSTMLRKRKGFLLQVHHVHSKL